VERGDDFEAVIVRLDHWAAAATADAAATGRRRQHWARQQAEEEATLASLLVALAERRD
jgi:hypothetical protein